MKRTLALLLLAALPARAQTRGAPVELPALPVPAAPAAFAAVPLLTPLASPAPLPSASPPVISVSPAVSPAPAAAPAPVRAEAKAQALSAAIAKAAASLGDPKTSAGDAAGAGRRIEAILTGAAPIPAAAESPAPVPAASREELDFVSGAGASLSRRADDLGAERGLKAGRMSGAEFLTLVDDARREADAAPAPSPAAAEAARAVRASLSRAMRALIPADRPLSESVNRALSVWQVFDQEMSVAAEKGTLAAVTDDAALFASQVEESVAPAPEAAAAPEPAPDAPDPADPEGRARAGVPGSVFGWKPIADSPGHGLPPVDALIRRALSERRSPARGRPFELAGAPSPADARVRFYGERHTDGGLIAANMKRLAAEAAPGRRLIVLVEGYTDWAMKGYDAQKYLADRGLDPAVLKAKGVTPEIRGWDTIDGYGASKHPLLQHHMNLLELNRLAHGETRGWRYYRDFAAAAWVAAMSWRALWDAAIVARNRDLDRAVAKAAADAGEDGASVAVIAGSDHLLENPRRVMALPRVFAPRFRESLKAALGGRTWWASRPPESN
jgi:hypothetical protein